MSVLADSAPAKVNLGLFVGPVRASDGRHELATVMQSISLADRLTLEPAAEGAEADLVSCPAVPGENLAAAALRAFRERSGWDAPPHELRIEKLIPVAAGLGGGSADAAAALRLARRASGLGDDAMLAEIAAGLGADVPAQLSPGRWLAGGAGERLTALPQPRGPLALLVLPSEHVLSTASVYARADQLGPTHGLPEIEELWRLLEAALAAGDPLPANHELLENDLQAAALSLAPSISGALDELADAGADHAMVSGSGPTVVGLFARGPDPLERAERAAAALAGRVPAPIVATALGG